MQPFFHCAKFQQSVYIGEHLKAYRWTQALSRAATKNRQLTGLELRYHEKNSETPVDPKIFLSKYKHVKELLSEMGFQVYRVQETNKELDEKRHLLVAEYKEYIEKYRPQRPKPYEALNHDIAVWQTIQGLRNKGVSALEAGAFFLTADHYFYRFDWQRLREQSDLGSVVLPNQFLQLLRPFVSITDDFDRRFVETFAIPE